MTTGTIIVLVIIGYFVLKFWFSSMRQSGRIKKYGNEFGSLINQGKIDIGMSKEMVSEALGAPAHSAGKTHRQNYERKFSTTARIKVQGI